MDKIKVSVLMPAYNADKYIDDAIRSVIAQTLVNWELLVIDDGSVDTTWEKIEAWMLKDHRIIGHRNQVNLGLCKTLNIGIKLCSAEYIARLDSDDIMMPNRLELQSDFLDSNNDCGIIGSSMFVCDQNMNIINTRSYPLSNSKIIQTMFYYSPFCHPAVMYRKTKVVEAGCYDVNMSPTEDIDFWFRLLKVTNGSNLDEPLVKYRVIGTSESQSKARWQEFKTLYTRSKAVFEYGYVPTPFQIMYNLAQLISMFIIPQKLKFGIFNFFRSL